MLNTEQQRAVDSNAQKLLVLSGAGSGKTTVLIQRISRLVNDGVDPTNILVLTFTSAAAFEMRERYSKTQKSGNAPKFSTFHAFCYSLIIQDVFVNKKV